MCRTYGLNITVAWEVNKHLRTRVCDAYEPEETQRRLLVRTLSARPSLWCEESSLTFTEETQKKCPAAGSLQMVSPSNPNFK